MRKYTQTHRLSIPKDSLQKMVNWTQKSKTPVLPRLVLGGGVSFDLVFLDKEFTRITSIGCALEVT